MTVYNITGLWLCRKVCTFNSILLYSMDICTGPKSKWPFSLVAHHSTIIAARTRLLSPISTMRLTDTCCAHNRRICSNSSRLRPTISSSAFIIRSIVSRITHAITASIRALRPPVRICVCWPALQPMTASGAHPFVPTVNVPMDIELTTMAFDACHTIQTNKHEGDACM